MPDYNKGDFTQQGIDGFVEGGLHLNEKRCLTAKISTDEDSAGLDSVEINIHDHLNDLDYTITGENLVVGENTIGGGGGGNGDLTTATLKVVVPEGVASDYIMGCFVMPAVPDQTPDTSFYQSTPYSTGDNEYQVILYKGGAVLVISQAVRSVSGDIASIGGDSYFMTGDCIVTLTRWRG